LFAGGIANGDVLFVKTRKDRSTIGGVLMDLATLKVKAAEETTRVFLERQGYVPDQDSDEWEDEYRRQFALAKERQRAPQLAAKPAPEILAAAQPAAEHSEWPQLSGPPAEVRWATSLRADRLKAIHDADIQVWLARSWTSAKSWIDTRELSVQAFLRRVQPRFVEHRRQCEEEAAALEAKSQAAAAVGSAIAEQIQAAGITVQGLIELVDVSPRTKTAPVKGKLAELNADDRRLRVFETTNPSTLLVIETSAADRIEYGIERDDGLVADLKLFAQIERR
jgi:hypothetical protein